MLSVVSGEGITCLEQDRTDRLQADVRAGVSEELVRSQLSSLGLASLRAHLTRADVPIRDASTQDETS
jgi:hypothetical protein